MLVRAKLSIQEIQKFGKPHIKLVKLPAKLVKLPIKLINIPHKAHNIPRPLQRPLQNAKTAAGILLQIP